MLPQEVCTQPAIQQVLLRHEILLTHEANAILHPHFIYALEGLTCTDLPHPALPL